jgi:hypothetical protein
MYWKKYYARRDIYLRSVDELIGKPVEPKAYGLPDVDKVLLIIVLRLESQFDGLLCGTVSVKIENLRFCSLKAKKKDFPLEPHGQG